VSQKKDASYDFDRTEFRTNYECISAIFDGRTFAIGKYDTPERAAEVFMDMHKAYATVQVVCTNMDEKQVSALVAASQNAPIRCAEMDDPRMAVTVFDNIVYYNGANPCHINLITFAMIGGMNYDKLLAMWNADT
jgi:hypothetical protein